MIAVFVDTSAFVALIDKKDRHHKDAKRALDALSKRAVPLITSTYVADEVITLARVRLGHRAAVEVGNALFQSRWCRLIEIDQALREAAWSLFVRYADQAFSFTDCTSFALMRALGAEQGFTFDSDFAAAGFDRLPMPTKL